MHPINFEEWLKQHRDAFAPVVPYVSEDKWLRMDFTEANTELTDETLKDTPQFTHWVTQQLHAAGARYGIGGYNEHRTVYRRSEIFDGAGAAGIEPRTVHLGTDIWGAAHTRVMAPLDGIVHSFAFNNAFGDYGATIILTHNLEGETFYTLYGHLSLSSLKNLEEGQRVKKGDTFCEFGLPFENGQWPPHLHFQIIRDMEGRKGDYPGVCAVGEREKYLAICPDADAILNLMARAVSF